MKYDACLLIHYDMFEMYPDFGINDIPIAEITEFCLDSNIPLIGVPGLTTSQALPGMDALFIPPSNHWPKQSMLGLLDNKHVLLTGGYKSLCVRELYDYLAMLNVNCYISLDNEGWLIDPASDYLSKDKLWEPILELDTGRILK